MNEEELQRIERGDPESLTELAVLAALFVGVLTLLSFIIGEVLL